MIDAIIFDLDGTILDSMGVWSAVDEIFLSENGLVRTPTFEEDMKPLHFKDTAGYFIRTYGIRLTEEEILARFVEIAADYYGNTVPEKCGASRFIRRARESGRRLSVATATEESLARAALRRLGVIDCFDFILTCDSFGRGKDSPEIYLECARRMGSSAENTAVIEDALHGVKSAKSAGFFVVGMEEKCFAADRDEIIRLSDIYIRGFDELSERGFLV